MFSKAKALIALSALLLMASAVLPTSSAHAGIIYFKHGPDDVNSGGVIIAGIGGVALITGLVSGVPAIDIIGGALIALPANVDQFQYVLEKSFPYLSASDVSSLEARAIESAKDSDRLEICVPADQLADVLSSGDYSAQQMAQVIGGLSCS